MNDQFKPYLLQGESIRWTGVPPQGLVLSSDDIWLIPFSLFWAGFVVFWNVAVFNIGAPLPFSLFGLVFLLIGFQFVFGRFLVDAYLRSKTRYALTEKRALILGGIRGKSLRSIDLKATAQVEFTKIGSDRGTISFGKSGGRFRQSALFISPMYGAAPTFFRVRDAMKAYNLIQTAKIETAKPII